MMLRSLCVVGKIFFKACRLSFMVYMWLFFTIAYNAGM